MYSSRCQRSRVLAALSVDGELLEVEARALARHLERCAACRSYARTVEGFTRQVRETELEPFRAEPLPFVRGARGAGVVRGSIAGVAVVSVAAVAFVSSSALTVTPNATPQATRVIVIDATVVDPARETQRFLHELRDVSLARAVGDAPPGLPNRPGPRTG